MKHLLFFILLLSSQSTLLAQVRDTALPGVITPAQAVASTVSAFDTTLHSDTLVREMQPAVNKIPELSAMLARNKYVNSSGLPAALAVSPRQAPNNDLMFYALAALVLMLAIARSVYGKYFSNMFRVFFNSSLRQSQITDQLVQDQLPSLIFNLIFVISGGFYVYLLLQFSHPKSTRLDWTLLSFCILAFSMVYLVKFIGLKFTGWVTGFTQEANIYTFVTFLINKILGILLIPIIIILSFSEVAIAHAFVWISFIVIGMMLLMRFLRSYGLLQHRIKVGRFHFLLYIFSLEILPLLIIYKGVMIFFNISL